MLECEIPEGTKPGDKFNIIHEDRYFEVCCPVGANPGETINVVVNAPQPAAGGGAVGATSAPVKFDSLQAIGEAALNKAAALSEKYKLNEKVEQLKEAAVTKFQELDAKYEVSKSQVYVAAQSAVEATVSRVKELDEQHHIIERVTLATQRLVACK